MRTMLALLALPLLAVCSPSDDRTTEEEQLPETQDAPETASEEALSSWTIDVGGGDAAGFQIVMEGSDLAITTTAEGHAWRPVDLVMGGDFAVSAVFEARDPASAADDQYGIILGGKNLGDADQAHTDFLMRATGEHKIARHEAGTSRTLVDWKSGPGASGVSASSSPSSSHQMEVHIAGEVVEFLVDGTVVATLARSEVQPHGVAGVHVGANASVNVKGWSVREPEPQVGQPRDSTVSIAPRP